MAFYSPIVIKDGEFQQLQSGDGLSVNQLNSGAGYMTNYHDTFKVGTNEQLHFRGHYTFANGVTIVAANDVDNALVTIELRTSRLLVTDGTISFPATPPFIPQKVDLFGGVRIVTGPSISVGLRLESTDTTGEGQRVEWYSPYGLGFVTGRMWSSASGAGSNFHISVVIDSTGVLTEAFLIDKFGDVSTPGHLSSLNVPITGTWNLSDYTTWDGDKVGSVGWYSVAGAPGGSSFAHGYRSKMADPNYGNELLIPYNEDRMFMRRMVAGSLQAWHEIPVRDANGNLVLNVPDESGLHIRQDNNPIYGIDFVLDQVVDGAMHINRVVAGTSTMFMQFSRATGAVGITDGLVIPPDSGAGTFTICASEPQLLFYLRSGYDAIGAMIAANKVGSSWQDAYTIIKGHAANTSAFTDNVFFYGTGAVRFARYGAGTLVTDGAGNITASSDATMKTIDGPFTRGSDDLLGIKPKLYHWNKKSGMDTSDQYAGPIAQDVLPNIPEAVGMGLDGKYTLQDRVILSALINAVNEHTVALRAMNVLPYPPNSDSRVSQTKKRNDLIKKLSQNRKTEEDSKYATASDTKGKPKPIGKLKPKRGTKT